MTSLTNRLGATIAAGHPGTAEWLDLGERAFTDTVGVLVAGAGDQAVEIVAATEGDHEDGPVRSLATGRPMSPRAAALIDGTSAHALDYDDVDDSLMAHPSAVLVPALLAAGQDRDRSGAAALHAYRTGLLAARAIGEALGIPGHYRAGWHSTGTVGTLGATAAVAALIGLDETAARHALGIAGSLAGGSRQNFGTMTKPLHVGMAASNGLTAAYLAERGFTADPDQLDGPLGFVALHRGPPSDDDNFTAGRTDGDAPSGLNVKRYPCCYATHAAIEATGRLADGLPAGAEVTAIDVAVHPGGLVPLIHHRPIDGTQAKFSMEYAVSATLLDGAMALASFEDERVSRPDVQQLLRRVTVTDEPTHQWSPDATWFAVVVVHCADGTTRSERVGNPTGHCSRPLSESQLRDKFTDCFQPATGSAVDDVYEAVRNLRHQPSLRPVVEAAVAARKGQFR